MTQKILEGIVFAVYEPTGGYPKIKAADVELGIVSRGSMEVSLDVENPTESEMETGTSEIIYFDPEKDDLGLVASREGRIHSMLFFNGELYDIASCSKEGFWLTTPFSNRKEFKPRPNGGCNLLVLNNRLHDISDCEHHFLETGANVYLGRFKHLTDTFVNLDGRIFSVDNVTEHSDGETRVGTSGLLVGYSIYEIVGGEIREIRRTEKRPYLAGFEGKLYYSEEGTTIIRNVEDDSVLFEVSPEKPQMDDWVHCERFRPITQFVILNNRNIVYTSEATVVIYTTNCLTFDRLYYVNRANGEQKALTGYTTITDFTPAPLDFIRKLKRIGDGSVGKDISDHRAADIAGFME